MSETNELAVIESAMQDTRGEYYNAPKDDTGHTPMQTQYRELTEAKESAPEASQPNSVSEAYWQSPEGHDRIVEYWQSPEGGNLYAEMERAGGYQNNVAAGSKMGDEFMQTIPPETSEEFQEQVGRLSPGVSMGILCELACTYIPRTSQASAETVASFAAATSAGAELVEEWGANASRKVADARARFKRAEGRMSVRDRGELDAFLKGTTHDEFKAILKWLAGEMPAVA